MSSASAPLPGTPSTPIAASRPGGLTALCILAIVLGALGLLTGLMTIFGLLFQGQMQSAIAGLQPDAEAARIQRELAEEAEQVMQQHIVRNWIAVVVQLNTAIALLFGGICSLRLKPIGRTTLLVAFAVAIAFAAFQLWPAFEARELSARTFDRMMQAQQQGMAKAPPGFEGFMKTLGQAIGTMQLVVAVVMFLAKSGFYGFGLWYLTRPQVANLFVRLKPPDTQWA